MQLTNPLSLLLIGLAFLLGGGLMWMVMGQKKQSINRTAGKQGESVFQRLVASTTRAANEERLVQTILDELIALFPLEGGAFVPLDVWGKPGSAWVKGRAPEGLPDQWDQRLAGEHVRGRCRNCQALTAEGSGDCPLLKGEGGVYCFPLIHANSRMAMLSLFAKRDETISSDQLKQIRLASSIWAQQLHVLRIGQADTAAPSTLIQNNAAGDQMEDGLRLLLESVLAALSAARLEIHLLPAPYTPISVTGSSQVMASALPQAALTIPIQQADGTALGELLAFAGQKKGFTEAETATLQSSAQLASRWISLGRHKRRARAQLILQERTLLSREIHDGMAQLLALLRLQNNQMRTALQHNRQERLEDLLNQNLQVLDEAFAEARRAISALRSAPQSGLSAWIADHLEEFKQTSSTEVQFRLADSEPRFGEDVQLQLVRIIQEALHNIRRHARATQAAVELRRENDHGGDWLLEIRDNGRGFDPLESIDETHFGLRGMRERAEWIGAEFQVVSKRGEGCVVQVRLPAALAEGDRA